MRIVTLTGEQFQPGGSLTGGATKRKRASVLSRKEEAASLEQELVQIEEQIRSLTASLENLENGLKRLKKNELPLMKSINIRTYSMWLVKQRYKIYNIR